MYTDKQDLLGLFHTLHTPLKGIRGYVMIILGQDKIRNRMPPEIVKWLEERAPTFDLWDNNLENLRSANKTELTATQLCQQIIGAFDGLEAVLNESNNLSQNIALEGEEKYIFDGIVNTLPNIYEHYSNMNDSLRGKEP